MKSVQVLLSTYNGENYLIEQLDSIINQDYPNITILVRDDGSTDGTIQILKRYSERYPQLTYYEGKNIGVTGSFFDLMLNADLSVDYFSFSDQDDAWMNNKISRAIDKLNAMNQEVPLLYCGKTTLADQDLLPISSSNKVHHMIPDFCNAIVENICTGCTCVINNRLLQLVRNHLPEYRLIHDWWLYLTASCFGEVYYDEESFILYRQHRNNVIGMKSNHFDELKKRLKSYRGNRGKISRQAAEFQKLFQLDKKYQKWLNYIINARNHFVYRLIILFSKKIYRQRVMDNVIFKILVLLGNV